MKVVKAKEMARIEQLAYAAGAAEEDFMASAGRGVAELVQHFIGQMHIYSSKLKMRNLGCIKASGLIDRNRPNIRNMGSITIDQSRELSRRPKFSFRAWMSICPQITLLCGSGNNAADAYAAGVILMKGGFVVTAIALAPLESSSKLCQLQAKLFIKKGGAIKFVSTALEIDFGKSNLIIDGILGTGFHGQVEGLYRIAIEKANASSAFIVSIDVPSGINGTTGEVASVAINASATLFLGLPKTGCFLAEAWNYVGWIHCYDFGLGNTFIDQAEEDFILINDELILSIFPPIKRTQHKYEAGYVVGLGGSLGMPGAPILASFSALRSGAGIVRLLHPAEMQAELGHSPPEVIKQGYHDAKSVLDAMERASAIFVGPGIGTSDQALKMLREILPTVNKPCVIDAEALTLLAHHKIALPPLTVMTPHAAEMLRLLKLEAMPPILELLKQCQRYSEEQKVTLVLKGAPTFIFHPGQKPYISARGDPGMATAGSGDVLTGIISAFLARTKNPFHSAVLGVHIHSVAGEVAAQRHSSYCMVASDIIDALPEVFKELSSRLNLLYHSTNFERPS